VLFIVLVLFIVVDLILLVPRTIYTSNGKLYVIVYLVNFVWVVYEVRAVYILLIQLKEAWEKENSAPEEEEPEPAAAAEGEKEEGGADNEAVVIESAE